MCLLFCHHVIQVVRSASSNSWNSSFSIASSGDYLFAPVSYWRCRCLLARRRCSTVSLTLVLAVLVAALNDAMPMKLAISLYSLQLYFCTRRGVFAFSLSSRSHSGACSALCLSSHFRLGRPWVSGLARFATRVAAVEQQFFISASFGACPCYSVGWRCRCLLARRRCFAVRADSGLGSHRCLLLLQWQFAVSVSSRSQKVQLQFTQTVRLAVTCAVFTLQNYVHLLPPVQ